MAFRPFLALVVGSHNWIIIYCCFFWYTRIRFNTIKVQYINFNLNISYNNFLINVS